MISYLVGDATAPVGDGQKIIAHICNDRGGWGLGFVIAVSKRWQSPERAYRRWYQLGHDIQAGPFQLGSVQLVPVRIDLTVANMIAQAGYNNTDAPRAVQYDALEHCLDLLKHLAWHPSAPSSIHMPRIGCGLGGGRWEEVEPIIQKKLWPLDVFVYDLPGAS